jgi:hypothetical protein
MNLPPTICIDAAAARSIYAILVREAGAWDQPIALAQFEYAMTETDTHEYRFQGHLGFGGKFWRDGNRWWVNCYPEDLNAERRTIIERTNKAIASLQDAYVNGEEQS